MNSREIKKIFKAIGISVKVRTVAVKNPFVQVWTEFDAPFPNDIRRCAIFATYGDNAFNDDRLNIKDQDSICYGNIRPNSLSFSGSEWEKFLKHIDPALQLSQVL